MTLGLIPHSFTERLIVADHSIEYSDGLCRYATAVSIADEDRAWYPHEFARDGDFRFSFVAPKADLLCLKVRFATHARMNDAPLWCELRDGDGALVAERFVAAQDVTDNALHELFDLRGVPMTPGALYEVLLQGRLAVPGNGLVVWTREVRASHFDVVRQIRGFETRRSFIYASEETSSGPLEAERRARRKLLVSAAPLATLNATLGRLSRAFPWAEFEHIGSGGGATLWPALADADVVVFDGPIDGDDQSPTGFDALCFALHRRGCATVWLQPAVVAELTGGVTLVGDAAATRRLTETGRRCRFTVDAAGRLFDVEAKPADTGDGGDLSPTLAALRRPLDGLCARLRAERWPSVGVVSVLYRKADVIALFIECVIAQSYPGMITLTLVDDVSPTDDAAVAAQWRDLLLAAGVDNRRITLLRNEANAGNCASRLNGLAASDSDIAIVIDCDCLLNKEFVAAHVFEHARGGVDVVIGPLNIEANGREPVALMHRFEADPALALAEAEPQDAIQLDGFLNCITRNFSIKRAAAMTEPLFDLDFSFSAKSDTGFGWEDVEMGFRLYDRDARIRYTPEAYSVHVSHPASASDRVKVLGSMRNFEKMFAKHPDMALVARRWALDVYDRLIGWAASQGVADSVEAQALVARFEQPWTAMKPMIRAGRPHQRRLRILSYRWHVPHQYELHKLPHDFTLATNTGRNGDMNSWSYDQRPLRPNVRFQDAASIRAEDYDLALLHFDENILVPQLCNGVIPASWGDPFRWLLGQVSLPKVAICHGTPQFLGQYAANPAPIDHFTVHVAAQGYLVDVMRAHDVTVVCNSHQAAEEEWRFHRSRVIWHGFDPQEFPRGRHDLDILALAPDRHRPHYRGAALHEAIVARLPAGLRIGTARHEGAGSEARTTRTFAAANMRSYVERIGRFRAYLNTTLRSPMPRSRGEAMMTGVFPVAIDNHDVDRFIEPGRNGFRSNDPDELADFLAHALRNPGTAARLGTAARRTALDLFNHDRYLNGWTDLLADTVR